MTVSKAPPIPPAQRGAHDKILAQHGSQTEASLKRNAGAPPAASAGQEANLRQNPNPARIIQDR
jgi:hypothetical protein